jgi:hypothetical protein
MKFWYTSTALIVSFYSKSLWSGSCNWMSWRVGWEAIGDVVYNGISGGNQQIRQGHLKRGKFVFKLSILLVTFQQVNDPYGTVDGSVPGKCNRSTWYCRTSICCFFLICNLQADSMFENILFFFQSSRRAFALPELLLLFDNVLGEDLWTEIWIGQSLL